ncbi:hypothetical protein RKE29_05085 [Streptomyces sp. B1866]|uniref:sirohydrochlorin chelatase n=1 Tax=Streptomyces sp. B1866 TaxID=3075431 RepID=UPI0028905659|nr:hypothetical protein [Streptomyces sp. B1866]MDT3396021.1 hypothetical protein [Streptomyces sp. B1866]
MSSPTGPASGLPVRMPRPRQPGRHRRPEPVAAPEGAPPLVLAVPGVCDAAVRGLAEEIVSIARSELPGLDARIGYLDGDGVEFPHLTVVLARAAAERTGTADRPAEHAEREPEQDAGPEAAERPAAPGDGLAAVVVPLLAGPDATLTHRIRQAVAAAGVPAEVTDPLGPHPLLAEAVHVRLSEAGLARADRARLFTVATAADGIVLAAAGGPAAAQAAGITGMLLSARLALPVMAAALDQEGDVARVAGELRSSGSAQLALAPCAVGPEVAPDLLARATAEAGCPAAEPIGAYPAVGGLVVAKYATVLGITPRPSAAMR